LNSGERKKKTTKEKKRKKPENNNNRTSPQFFFEHFSHFHTTPFSELIKASTEQKERERERTEFYQHLDCKQKKQTQKNQFSVFPSLRKVESFDGQNSICVPLFLCPSLSLFARSPSPIRTLTSNHNFAISFSIQIDAEK